MKSVPAEPPVDIEEIHLTACNAKRPHYIDPTSSLMVFTSYYLSKRKCCGCGCRHCPYKPRAQVNQPARLLNGTFDDLPESVDVLFWSGGKDSYLSLRALQRAATRAIVLLTTYDAVSGSVAHQEVAICEIIKQAKKSKLHLLGVPIANGAYVTLVRAALDRMRDHGVVIERIAFGDLHLQHVRNWRQCELDSLGAELCYPIWGVSYDLLLKELVQANVTVRISAVDDENEGLRDVKVGDVFDAHFVARLPREIDEFGENGEFHTLVEL